MEINNIRDIIGQLTSQEIKPADNNLNTVKQTEKRNIETKGRSDEISISEEGKRALEIQRYSQLAKKLPSVRQDVIDRVQQRILNDQYSERDVIEKTAGKILGL